MVVSVKMSSGHSLQPDKTSKNGSSISLYMNC